MANMAHSDNGLDNNFDNYDVEYRQADEVKEERLIDVPNYRNITITEEDAELRRVLELSKYEYNVYSKLDDKDNKDLYNALELSKQDIDKLIERRKTDFTSIKPKLSKLMPFDTKNKQMYENMLTNIDLYEQGFIDDFNTDSVEELSKYLLLVSTIRLTPEERQRLNQFIVCREN